MAMKTAISFLQGLQGKSGTIKAPKATEALEDEIYSLRRKNHESRHFIPRKALLELLQPAKIRAALVGHVPPHQLDEILGAVYPHGRLLFAILVRTRQIGVLPRFIERDQLQLQYGQLDQKLPLEERNLSSIIGQRPAQRFCEEQWEVIPPVFSPFSIQRFLAEPTTLPFLRQQVLGQGSFGQVYEVEIDPDHQLFQDAARKVRAIQVRIHVQNDDGRSSHTAVADYREVCSRLSEKTSLAKGPLVIGRPN